MSFVSDEKCNAKAALNQNCGTPDIVDDMLLSEDASGFVLLSDYVPDLISDLRYCSAFNFVGEQIDGYEEPVAILTKEAASALKAVADDFRAMGLRLKIFDAYRPQKAVDHFVRWALDQNDIRMKEHFYPDLEKDVLFSKGYIAAHSEHSRGSAVDLTLFDVRSQTDLDMGGSFDFFGERSHPDYKNITAQQYGNRMLLRSVMLTHGFRPLAEEWWHFSLADEPFPNTYFNFPVNRHSVKKTGDLL